VLNDETHLSEWCQYEWTEAAAAGLPVKVVVDMERCSKREALKTLGAAHPKLMVYQWTELTDRHRRDCLAEVGDFLLEATETAGAGPDQGSDSGALRFGADGQQVMHDAFEVLLIFGGVPYRTPSRRAVRSWVFFVLCGRAVCLATCITRLVYAHGPSYTDFHSCLGMVLVHTYIFYAPFRLNRALRSDAILKMLATLQGGTAAELGQRLHRHTFRVAVIIFALVAVACALVYVAFLPLFFHPGYVGQDAELWDMAFGWVSGLVFMFLIPSILASFLASFALMYLLLHLGNMQLEVSFDQIHPNVAELGLHRFYAIAHVKPLTLTNAALTKFNLAWNVGVRNYHFIQREIAAAQVVGVLTASVGLTAPLGLLLRGYAIDETVHWANVVRLFVAWLVAGSLQVLGIFLPALRSTEALRRLRWAAAQVVPDNPMHRVFFTQIYDASPLTCFVAWVLPASRPTALALVALVGGSLVPFLYLDCYGVRLVDVLSDHALATAGATGDTAPLARLAAVTGFMTLLLLLYGYSLVMHRVADWRAQEAEAVTDDVAVPMEGLL